MYRHGNFEEYLNDLLDFSLDTQFFFLYNRKNINVITEKHIKWVTHEMQLSKKAIGTLGGAEELLNWIQLPDAEDALSD